MRLQILSDLHLETENYVPQAAPGAELLVLAGDIDRSWQGLDRFAGWPVPVLFVAGNHEFDAREWNEAWPALRTRCEALGLQLLERQCVLWQGADGRRVRFVGTTRWSDFNAFGPQWQAQCERAGSYFTRVMRATRAGAPFNAAAVRAEALACRAWLEQALRTGQDGADATVVITHFAPCLRSADPRYGLTSATASFCNADDDLLPLADLWIHGHLHCCHDYRVPHAGGSTRVLSNARGHTRRGEGAAHQPLQIVEV